MSGSTPEYHDLMDPLLRTPAEDWDAVYETVDMYAKQRVSFRSELERLVFALDHGGSIQPEFEQALEALYPETGGIPPWRTGDVGDRVLDLSGAGPDGDLAGAPSEPPESG